MMGLFAIRLERKEDKSLFDRTGLLLRFFSKCFFVSVFIFEDIIVELIIDQNLEKRHRNKHKQNFVI